MNIIFKNYDFGKFEIRNSCMICKRYKRYVKKKKLCKDF